MKRYRLLSFLLFKTNYSCECAQDHCLQILSCFPLHLLPTQGSYSRNMNRRWRPSAAPTGFDKPLSALPQSRPQWLIQPSTVPSPLHTLSLMKWPHCVHHLAQCVIIDRQRSDFKRGTQERCGNYWRRHDIVWRERTMLQAAFAPYLPPHICLPHRRIDWPNLIGVLRLFVWLSLFWRGEHDLLPRFSQCHTRIIIEWLSRNSTDRTRMPKIRK